MIRWGPVARRLVSALLLVYVAVTFNFLLFRLAPGNPTAQLSRVPQGGVALQHQLEREFGLNRPVLVQYGRYLDQLVHGNLGVSFVNRQPVTANLLRDLGNTLPMVAVGTLLAIGLGIATGISAGGRRGGPFDHGVVGFATLAYSLPAQWIGLGFLFVFSGVLPAGGMSNEFLINPSFITHILDVLKHMILPSVTLALVLFGQYTLIVRSAVVETLSDDYVLTARGKGLNPREVIRRHVVRNALLPTVTLIGLSLGALVGGAILVETVFSWPGIGREIYQSVVARDYPMLQGEFLIFTLSVVLCNLAADATYAMLDPRVRT